MPRKTHEEIERELESAKKRVKIGGTYAHYKNQRHYTVTAIGLDESTERPCVVYRDAENEKLIFIRDLEVWLEEPMKGTPRFGLVSGK